MNAEAHLLPLGDFKPADEWQTHVNEIFYGIQGPDIHDHFQTYVSQDHRLAHALAEDYFKQALKQANSNETHFIMEWGVGNGNLAGCFLSHLKSLDIKGQVYPSTRYILCDFSIEILKGASNNERLKKHAGKFFMVQVDANRMNCFQKQAINKIISNEIWDDLSTKVLLKRDGSFYEEYIQPLIDPVAARMNIEDFIKPFNEKNLNLLKGYPNLLKFIIWERTYQRVTIDEWPQANILEAHMSLLVDEIPIPVNIGALATFKRARHLLKQNGLGYTGMDYGMYSMQELNFSERPYFNLYGGQYTFMVNFELLNQWAHAEGFASVEKEHQHSYVGRHLQDSVISVVELVQTHSGAPNMPPWDRDILMLKTLNILNKAYKNNYPSEMKYNVMEGTPSSKQKQIKELAAKLSTNGVPDTVAYVTKKEVMEVSTDLAELGYDEKIYTPLFKGSTDPISFVIMNLC
ncbi:MAG: hypothetical protein HOB32_03190 [Nitrospina sp.]|nr:hypothetical protein [Nitrospina sp.]MBT6600656.1 hypothetical protein [Nitrospina sp.]